MREIKTTISCTDCELRSRSLFARVSDQALERAGYVPQLVSYRPNSPILRPSSASDAVFTLRKGAIKLERSMPDGSHRITAILQPGDTLGLRAWQSGSQDFHVTAIGEVELCRIPYTILERIRQYDPNLDASVMEHLCRESEQADLWITHFSTGSVNRRLANLLLYLAQKQHDSPQQMVRLLTREDMASILSVRQESVSRAVTQFKEDGLIQQQGRGLFGLDIPALEAKASSK